MLPETLRALSDRVAIVGVGTSATFGRSLEKDAYLLAAEAFKSALDDCGLRKNQIDGLHSIRLDYDRAAKVLGLDVRFINEARGHGRLNGNFLVEAVLLLAAGLVHYMAIIFGTDFGTKGRRIGGETDPLYQVEQMREGGGPFGEDPVFGMTAVAGMIAMQTRRYFHLYGAGSRDLAEVAVSHREWALLNPLAVAKKPLTIESHQQSRLVIDPLRVLDYCLTTDGATCVILTTSDRARALRKAPIYVSGLSPVVMPTVPHNKDLMGSDGKSHLGPREKLNLANTRLTYEMSGLSPRDIDVFYCYDAFTPMVLFSLEAGLLCGIGEASDFIKGSRTRPGGSFPVNPHGGLLSESHCGTWNHIVDAVRQLRGECGSHQVAGAEVAMYASPMGDSVVLRR